MCGRITQKSPPDQLRLTNTPDDPRVWKAREADWVTRNNGAPGARALGIRQNRKTGERSIDQL
jgi:hypothetical protein